MSERAKKLLVSYCVAALLGIGVAVLVAFNYGIDEANDWLSRFRILCDACTIPGVLLLCFGILSWIADQGTFDSLSYAAKSLLRFLQPRSEHIRYYEYVEERREKRAEKERGHFAFLIVTGLAFLLAAGVFMILFYNLYG